MGVNCFVVTGWKISQPHRSHVYALTSTAGFTSETLVVMPRTVIRCPRCSPRTLRTARAFWLRSVLDPDGVSGLKVRVYRRVSSGGNIDANREVSVSLSAAMLMVSLRLSRWDMMISSTSSLNLWSSVPASSFRMSCYSRYLPSLLRHYFVHCLG